MTIEPGTAASPYLSLRQAVRPAILAHRLLAGDQERAGKLATECEDLLYLTGELLKAAGRARLLATAPPPRMPDEDGGDRQAQLLEAYADAGLLWAKVVGSSLALADMLIERGEWEDVRALASFLAGAGEESAAAELRIQVGRAAWEAHSEQLRAVSNDMPPAAIEPAINALRAVLREVPEEYPDRNREVNRFLPPLASAIHTIMKEREADIPYHSRIEHIATGGVAKYPDIVKTSLDELAAEFEGICRPPGGKTNQGALCQPAASAGRGFSAQRDFYSGHGRTRMAGVINDIEALAEFRAHLMRFNHDLAENFTAMQAHWRELGEVWRDDMYRLFGEALEEVTQGIAAYLSATEGHEAHLAALVERLSGYLETGAGAGLGVGRPPEAGRRPLGGTGSGTGQR